MRKADREIKDFEEIKELLDECQTIRLAMHDEPYPYIVPLSYGWEERNRQIFIYFHCAKEGKKLDLITKNGNVCFEADCLAGYKSTGHGVTADYRSLIAFGKAERVYGEELVRGLELLLAHCHVEGYSARECAAMGITAVVRITVDGITGKRRFAE
ncbi:MAG TPA: pyridoxamine 5'-phosphate oxidase family protein [Candidatus Coproplasma stercoripullorum]|uniref:Pyridoxamine 5'-phosphate oxidase family protein n=1 Tax=Candidatus Coproplasma stercoripullorum TaxID=2840751 RepID=A0A9D1AH30_9FIRM|nr:pyridoxamine 5'-phosphate oxidase family protein [Candidatus Coproplasma stercoripullorum]